MLSEQNKTIVREGFNEQVINQNRLDLVDELLAESFVDHSAVPPLPATREGVKAYFAAFHAAFAGCHVTVLDQVAEGDKVVTRKVFHGTHTGEFFGIPPTGKSIECQVIDILRLQDGRITDHWNVVDQLGMLQQLGAIPQPEAATA